MYVFYVSGRLRGGTDSDDLGNRVGPLKKDLTRAGRGEGGRGGWGRGVGGSICRVLRRSEALGRSFVRVLRVGEALGWSGVYSFKTPGGSAKERPSRAWGGGGEEGGEARSVVF